MILKKIFITGSADGLGKLAAQALIAQGHRVVLHARDEKRCATAKAGAPGAVDAVSGDLSSIKETIALAEKVNALGHFDGHFDAVIHNAGVGYQQAGRQATADDLPTVFAVNSLAPYILTCLIRKPKRLIYLSSGLHRSGDATLQDLTWKTRRWNGYTAYSDSKLHDTLLSFAVARRWPDVYANAMEPGWVPTKMGGPGAPDSLEEGYATQVWLAGSNEPAALVSGQYFYHRHPYKVHPSAHDTALQDRFIEACEKISGIRLSD